MKVRVWGSRGSVPVSGAQFMEYGGDTSCVELESSEGETVILDAGTGIRAFGNEALTQGKREFSIVLSHAHWDHLCGLPFFRPLYRDESTVRFFVSDDTAGSILESLRTAIAPPFFPLSLNEAGAKVQFVHAREGKFVVGTLHFQSIPLSHPGGGCGFRVEESNEVLVYLPDNELRWEHPGGASFDEYVNFAREADVLIHDAEYLPQEYEGLYQGWGHSTHVQALDLATAAGVKTLVLWHINQDRSDSQVTGMLNQVRQLAAQRGVPAYVEIGRPGLIIDCDPSQS